MSTSGRFMQMRLGVTPTYAGGGGWPTNGLPPGARIKGGRSWETDDTSVELDGTDTESGGYGNPDAGVKDLTINIELVIDTGEATFPGFESGDLISDLFLYANSFNAAPLYDIPYAQVFKAGVATQLRQQVTQKLTIKSKGIWAGPKTPVLATGSPQKITRPVVSPDA